MADIDIVPKHRSYVWLWIVIALVIIAILWYALAGHRGGTRVGLSQLPPPPMVATAVR